MRKVISNSTPLIILSKIDELEILKNLYGEIIIPQAVFEEITIKSDTIKNLSLIKILEVQDKSDRKIYQTKLHDGEVEVMMLAKKFAKFLDFKITGTLGILLKAKSEKIISEVRPILEKMLAEKFYISEKIINLVLKTAGE